MNISVGAETSGCMRINFSVANNWYYYSPTYIDFDVIIKNDVFVKQNICLPSIHGNTSLSFSKFRLYYDTTNKKYYIDIYYTRPNINECGVLITNKSPLPNWSATYSPQNFVSVDETIPDTTKMKLEYSFTIDS